MLEESITTPATSDNRFTQKLTHTHNSKIALKFEGNCLKQDKVFFTHGNSKLFYCLQIRYILNTDFKLKDFFWADPNQYSYAGYGIRFDSLSLFLISNFYFGRKFIFRVDTSSSMYSFNRKKYILVLGEGPTQG